MSKFFLKRNTEFYLKKPGTLKKTKNQKKKNPI